MSIFTKINGLRLLLSGVCMLLLFNVIFNYMGDTFENILPFNRLSSRKMRKYVRAANSTIPLSNIFTNDRSEKNSIAISVNSSIFPSKKTFLQNLSKANIRNLTDTVLGVYGFDAGATDGVKTQANDVLECEYPILENGGPITPNTTLESLDVVEYELGPLLKPGGYFQPLSCIPRHHVAIVVPFRDRYAHLSVFLRNIHPFLMKQHIAYRIFIVEQTNGKAFNRAAMMNIGFLEALKIFRWDCFIFHDVDLLPLDDRNLYTCPRQPRHMSVAIDNFNFKLPYGSIFGGVSAMTRQHFELVNGFSNSYFGWGGEDDDMSNRLRRANLFISRYPVNIARYLMLKHQKEKANPKRYERLVNGVSKMDMDGLNSIKYEIYSIKEFPTFTWYLAELKITDQKR